MGLFESLVFKLHSWYQTHEGVSDAHHTKYTDAEVDTIVGVHTADDDAHHAKYTDTEAEDAVDAAGYFKDGDFTFDVPVFGHEKLSRSSLDNVLTIAEARYVVTAGFYNKSDDTLHSTPSAAAVAILFNGNYEDYMSIPAATYLKLNINFGGNWPGYGYGYFFISHYWGYFPVKAVSNLDTIRVYCNYAPHGLGWHSFSFEDYYRMTGSALLTKSEYMNKYRINPIEFKIYADDTNARGVSEIDWFLTRPKGQHTQFFDKARANDIYHDLTMKTGGLFIETSKTPASAAAAGSVGEIIWDTNYIYICVAANTWKRVSIATW